MADSSAAQYLVVSFGRKTRNRRAKVAEGGDEIMGGVAYTQTISRAREKRLLLLARASSP